ncbi:MAG: ROK family protein [Candidatus Latescibacterota bacterium]
MPTNRGPSEHAVAVDLGGTTLVCAVVDRRCRVLHRSVAPSRAGASSQAGVAHLEECIRRLVEQAGLRPDELAGLGVGVPGIVYPEEGVVHRATNLPHWRDVPLAARLRAAFGVPVCVGHDVDMAALAETEYGAGRGHRHVACITLGTGVGVGLVLDGRLYRGARAGAGNLGDMVLAAGAEEPPASLESQVAGPALRRQAMAALRRGEPTSLRTACGGDAERLDARLVFAAAREGDPPSLALVRRAATLLGLGVANLVNLLSPEVVVVGGSMALAGDVLFDPLRQAAAAHVCPFLRDDLRIVPAQLGEDAGLVGAAHVVWQAVGRPS